MLNGSRIAPGLAASEAGSSDGTDAGRPAEEAQFSDEETRAWIAAAACLRPRVAGYVRRTTQEAFEVDDLLAETWVEAWREFAFGSPQLPDERTLIGHARKACAHWKATHRHEVELAASGELSCVESDRDDTGEQIGELFSQTLSWISELPRQQHYAIVFRDLRGSSFQAVAAAMGCSESAAKTHYWRGVGTLRRRRAAADQHRRK